MTSVRLPAYWLGRRPEDPVILTSYGASLAEDKSRQVREIIEGTEYSRLFPGISTRPDSRAKNRWHLIGARGGMLAAGIGGPVTGTGAGLGIIDDPVENWEQAQSETYRERAWSWYRTTFRTRIWEGGAIVVIMTRWHKDDLAGRLLADQPGAWEVLRLPALAETQEDRDANDKALGLSPGRPDPIDREPGEPLCPGRYSLAELHALRRDVGPIAWPAEYQGVPHEAEGAVFKRAWFKFFEDRNDHYVLPGGAFVIARDCEVFTSVDPAVSEKETADYTAIVTMALTPKGDLLVLDMVRERLGIQNIVPRLATVCRQWQPNWVAFEADNFQVGVAKQARAHKDIPTVQEMKSQGKGKLVRAHGAIVRAEQGTVYLPAGAGWTDDFLDELASFTGNDDAHDDQVDAFAQGIRALDRYDLGEEPSPEVFGGGYQRR